MATTKSGVNKTASILQYKEQHPDAMPKAIAEALQADGVQVNAGYVSTILSKSRKTNDGGTRTQTKKRGKKKGVRAVRQTKTAATRRTATSAGHGEVSVEVLMHIKEMVNQMGGVRELRNAIDAYENLMNS